MRHILLAEEMADWLKLSHFSWLGKTEKINPKSFQDDLDGRTGIIFSKITGNEEMNLSNSEVETI